MDHDQGDRARPRKSAPTKLDTMNRHGVGTRQLGGGQVVILRPPRALTKGEALMFAAYVATLAETLEPHDVTFADALRLVRKT